MTKDSVVRFLHDQGGYRLVDEALSVADLEFHFDGVLVGPGDEGGLVLIVDVERHASPLVIRRISAFARVLDRTASRRPLAAVLVNASKQYEVVQDQLEAVARVVRIADGDALDITLRRLLPLDLPEYRIEPSEAAEAALRTQLADLRDDTLALQIVDAASQGQHGVRDLIREQIRSIATRVLGESSE